MKKVKVGKIFKITLMALVFIGVSAYVVYAMLFLSVPDENEICADVELIVKQNSSSKFVDEEEMEKMLKNANVYPKGMLMKDVNTKKIEEIIRKNEFVANVECYKSANGNLCIKVEQRVPVMFIAPEGRDGYFVDAQGTIIPARHYAVNLVVASGKIDENYASTRLAEFGQFLQKNAFWNNQIEQLYVQKNQKGEPVVEIVPRVGDNIIYLGSIDDYQKKLQKLKTFYEKAVSVVGWDKYARVNIEYDNQIICTKRDISHH